MSFNLRLCADAPHKTLISLGFIEHHYEDEDTFGQDYRMENELYLITIDPWYKVQLCRKNPDTDFITLECDDLADLKCIIDWIQP
jgi:hypothetical protein